MPKLILQKSEKELRVSMGALHDRIHEAWQKRKGFVVVHFTEQNVTLNYAETGRIESFKVGENYKSMVV
jgi:hypothetical protein